MKLNPFSPNASAYHGSRHDPSIDAALRLYGRATPAPGLEGRIAARLATRPRRAFFVESFLGLTLLRRLSTTGLVAASACAIVVGTVRHSHHAPLPPTAKVPLSGNLSSAGASHIPTHATPQSARLDPQAPRTAPRHRAVISAGNSSDPGPMAQPQH